MSTVTVVKKNGVVAMAADTMSSFGSLKLSASYDKTAGKIVRLGGSFIGMTGWAVSQQVLEHAFRKPAAVPALASVDEIFDVFRQLHQRMKEEYFLIPRGDQFEAFEASHLHALIANRHGIFSVGSQRTVIEHDRFWASGSGTEYALGAMHALYGRDADAQAIAEAGALAGVEFDASSGAPIESRVIPLATPAAVDELELLLKV